MVSNRAEIVRRLRAACRRDPAKASVCGGLAVVLVVMWGRVMFRAGPPAAVAARPATATPAAVAGGRPRSTSEKAVVRWLTGPKPAVTRDLFDSPVVTRDDSAGREGKSAAAAADVERQKAEAAVRQRAGDLRLASTVLGERPRAVVNGELVEVGDTVAGFTVVRIEARRIVVRDGAVEATVDMD